MFEDKIKSILIRILDNGNFRLSKYQHDITKSIVLVYSFRNEVQIEVNVSLLTLEISADINSTYSHLDGVVLTDMDVISKFREVAIKEVNNALDY